MAGSGPGIPVKVRLVPRNESVRTHNQAEGAKPGSFYKAATRSRKDRDYVPTDVWDELG